MFSFREDIMRINCVNGNSFLAAGCDDPSSVKSTTDPTDAWYEEADKITEDDYTTVSTSLRSSEVRVQEWISFNPESDGDYEDSWLYKLVEDSYHGTYEWTEEIEIDNQTIEIKYCSCHTTYKDNQYCPPERAAKNIATTQDDDYKYTVYIRGQWGTREVLNPFATAYDEKKHVGNTKHNHNTQTYVLIDFNYDPFSCAIYNAWFDRKVQRVHQVDEIAIVNGTTVQMAEAIKAAIGHSINTALFGGDYNGNASRIGRYDNKSLYKELQQELGVSWGQFVLKSNPPHKISRQDCNYFLKHFEGFLIGEHCKETRRDLRMVQVDAYGSIIKKNRKDVSQRADLLDNFRYLVNTFFKKAIEKHKKTGLW
jgi:PBSX family phage terminase large subunit